MTETPWVELLGWLRAGDQRGATGLVLSLVDRGMAIGDLVDEVLAPAQSAVGESWARDEVSVATEHRATAITQAVLELAEARRQAPLVVAGPVVPVLCCEGEWHTLAARMAAAVLRERGVGVAVVGPSLPARDVGPFLATDPSPVVLVASSRPANLLGTWRIVSEVRRAGAWVVGGGRGFGRDGAWAAGTGVDHWCPTFRSGGDAAERLLTEPPPPGPREPVAAGTAWTDVVLLLGQQAALVERAAAAVLGDRSTLLLDDGSALFRDEVGSLLEAVAAAVLAEDRSLVVEHVEWLESVIGARRLPLHLVHAAAVAISRELASLPRLAEAAQWAASAATQPSEPLAGWR
ncbi:MAG TPA: B12-binding domain-containing protein [Actinotalea sp.]|nr:B12-binding domain-containing protein [Actinotalea sp.]